MVNEMIMDMGNIKNVRFRKVEYPGITPNKYFISEYGDLYNIDKERFHSLSNHPNGYLQVSVGNKMRLLVHRLVAYAFVENNRDLNLTVDHIDGNKRNNHYTNLEWVTLGENIRRAFRNGINDKKFEGDNNSKQYKNIYPDELVHTICEMYEQYNYSPIEIYRTIRNSDTTPRGNKESEAFYRFLVSLRKKETRSDITCMYDYDPDEEFGVSKSIQSNTIFSKEVIKIIATLYTEGKSLSEITKLFIPDSKDHRFMQYYSVVTRIAQRKSWTNITDEIFEAAGDFKAKKSTNGKFNETQVHMICKYIAEGDNPHMVLSKLGYFKNHPDYKKLYETVGRITNGKYWRHISKDYFEPRKLKEKAEYHLDDDLIREMVAHGYGMKDICTVYGMGTKIENPNYYRAILAKVSKFRKLQSESELTLEELNELIINAWAAEW